MTQESPTPENANISYARAVTKRRVNEYEVDHFIGKVYTQMIAKKYAQLQLKPGLKKFGVRGHSCEKRN